MRAREDIEDDVVRALYRDTRVDADEVTVRVEDGTVVLGGTVPS